MLREILYVLRKINYKSYVSIISFISEFPMKYRYYENQYYCIMDSVIANNISVAID